MCVCVCVCVCVYVCVGVCGCVCALYIYISRKKLYRIYHPKIHHTPHLIIIHEVAIRYATYRKHMLRTLTDIKFLWQWAILAYKTVAIRQTLKVNINLMANQCSMTKNTYNYSWNNVSCVRWYSLCMEKLTKTTINNIMVTSGWISFT